MPRLCGRWEPRLAVWTAIGLAFATSTYGMYAAKGTPLPWREPLFWALTEWYLWAALCPLIFWLARRFPDHRATWPAISRCIVARVPRRPCVHEVAYVMLERAAGMDGAAAPAAGPGCLLYVTKRAAFNILVYTGIVASCTCSDLYYRYRERERRPCSWRPSSPGPSWRRSRSSCSRTSSSTR